ncbi:sensor histidine kinase [Pedobacter duraquae]|uniref:Histidine kinase n=1 Tax=Pedobacter duraquae TaxID=425511 RepID=A0A4R6IC89_9SPHI|nr:sensor histidine kinase [Pedobacter duraquae]TDO19552.1 histidine kinase [Pedobacter duraquae]
MKSNIKSVIRKVISGWLIHLGIFWLIIVVFRMSSHFILVRQGFYQIYRNGRPLTLLEYFVDIQDDLWKVALFLVLTEVCYLIFFPRVRLPLYALCCIIVGIITFIPVELVRTFSPLENRFIYAVTPVISMAAYGFVYGILRDYFVNAGRRKALRLQQAEHELHALKAQLNPHFLFNSLNYLYGTALREHASDTAEGIDRLSEMMRYTISGMHDNMVPLAKELNFVKHYIALQQVRMADASHIQLVLDTSVETASLQIPPLIMLPFLENAFIYGISIDQPELIHININLEGEVLKFKVSNSIVKNNPDGRGNKTGIKNTLKRLQLIYPDGYDYSFSHIGNNYCMSLQINLKPL